MTWDWSLPGQSKTLEFVSVPRYNHALWNGHINQILETGMYTSVLNALIYNEKYNCYIKPYEDRCLSPLHLVFNFMT